MYIPISFANKQNTSFEEGGVHNFFFLMNVVSECEVEIYRLQTSCCNPGRRARVVIPSEWNLRFSGLIKFLSDLFLLPRIMYAKVCHLLRTNAHESET